MFRVPELTAEVFLQPVSFEDSRWGVNNRNYKWGEDEAEYLDSAKPLEAFNLVQGKYWFLWEAPVKTGNERIYFKLFSYNDDTQRSVYIPCAIHPIETCSRRGWPVYEFRKEVTKVLSLNVDNHTSSSSISNSEISNSESDLVLNLD